jgi:phenylpropionate dioxygenase-like ring-hydroxylating dioxygenase large terminal subunit
MGELLDDRSVVQRILDHIDGRTTDLGDACWREPVANYQSEVRLQAELTQVFRRTPTPFCPSAALARPGDFVAREAAGTPLVAVRGADKRVRTFRNACRHRGAQVACDAGRKKAFTCPYHGWTYGLDGALRHVPHEDGFPGLDKAEHGLVPVKTAEAGGVVFVTQDLAICDGEVSDAPELLGPDLAVMVASEQDIVANWKIQAEGFLEGYHIYATHRDTFFPVQFDNLNVVEHFGRNSRVTFPYRSIQKLRAVEPKARRVAGALTYVYHIFPNVMVATFPTRVVMVILEPVGVGLTRNTTYTLAPAEMLAADASGVRKDAEFVNAGAREDQAVVQSIQRGMASGANRHFTFGRFEGAVVHFHRQLHALLGEPPAA